MKILILILFILSSIYGFNQINGLKNKTILPLGVVEKIESKALNESRILNIYLPQGYHQDSSASYPVIYVLDGSAHEDFPHIAGLVQFLNMYNLVPKSIVVGIENVDRYRDFTYPSNNKEDIKAIPTSGGSASFINFLENEVQPLINENYHTNNKSTIIGQSLGGLLATEILITKPKLFSTYIIVSPSLWWDDQKLLKKAETLFKSPSQYKQQIYIGVGGKEHPVMVKTATKLYKYIKHSKSLNVNVFFNKLKSEDHASILHRAVYNAFEKLHPKSK